MQCSLYLIFYPLSHAHKATVMELKWNKNGNWLLTASRDHLLKVFDIRNMKEEIQTFKGHKKEATGRLNYRYILIKLTWMRSIRLKLNIFFIRSKSQCLPFWLNSILYSFSLCMQTIEVIPFIFRIAQIKIKNKNISIHFLCTLVLYHTDESFWLVLKYMYMHVLITQ